MEELPELKTPKPGQGQNDSHADDAASVKIMNSSLVMKVISSNLPVSTLLTLRETCKMWNHNFFPRIRKFHHPISLAMPGADVSICCCSTSGSLTDYLNIIQDRDDEALQPFSRYTLEPRLFPFRPNSPSYFRQRGCKLFGDLAFSLGVYIARLELEFCWSWDLHVLPIAEFRKLIFEQTPHLEELILLGGKPMVYPDGGDDGAPPPEPGPGTSTTVKVLPKLKRFKMAAVGANESYSALTRNIVEKATELAYLNCHIDPLRSLLELKDSDHVRKLKTLKLSLVSVALLEQLVSLAKWHGLQLKSVYLNLVLRPADLHVERQRETTCHFHNFFCHQASTLLKLHIAIEYFGYGESPILEPFVQIPRLEHLHTLKIKWDKPGLLMLKFGGYASSFEQTFPALRRFVILELHKSVTEEYVRAMSEIAHSQVTRLAVFKIRTVNQLERLAARFPAVTDLFVSGRGTRGAAELTRTLWPELVTYNGCRLECQREKCDDESDTDFTDNGLDTSTPL